MTDTSFCRLCAEIRPTSDLLILDKDELSINLNLHDKIYRCFQIQIEKSDKLPKGVCSECCQQVLSTYEFTEKIQQAQTFLNSLFNQSNEGIKTECHNETLDYTEPAVRVKIEKDDNDEKDYKNDKDDNDELSDDSYKYNDAKSDSSSESDEPLSARLSSKKKVKLEIEKSGSSRKKIKKHVELNPKKAEEIKHKRQLLDKWKSYKWLCRVCQNEFTSVQKLREHYDSKHDKMAPQYVCVECSKVYESYGAFRQHVNNHRNKFRFRCDICGKYENKRALLDRHLATHSDVRKFTCSVCGKNFKTRNCLYSHSRRHSPDKLKVRLAECDICHKHFQPSYLLEHKKIHADIREHICEYCGIAFHLQANLLQHIFCKHQNDAYFYCTRCPKRFKRKYVLKRHQDFHDNIARYKCDQCDKVFRQSGGLKSHQLTHSEKLLTYECKVCKKGFTRKQYLTRHLRQHTGDRPFYCKKCDHRFSCTSNFVKHLKRRHGLKQVSTANNQHEYPFIN